MQKVFTARQNEHAARKMTCVRILNAEVVRSDRNVYLLEINEETHENIVTYTNAQTKIYQSMF